jgi:hypothetical protein
MVMIVWYLDLQLPMQSVSDDDEYEIEKKTSRLDFLSGPCRAAEQAEEFVKRVWEAGWRVVHHHHLPDW